MLHFGLDLLYALQIEIGPCGQGLGRLVRHQSRLGQRLGSGNLYRQPHAVLVLIAP